IAIHELIGKGKKQITMDKVRVPLVTKYAGEDADAALQLAARFEPQLAERGFRDLYDKVEVPLIAILAEMELTGIRVDVPYLEKLGGEMGTDLAAIEKDVHALAGGELDRRSPTGLQKNL